MSLQELISSPTKSHCLQTDSQIDKSDISAHPGKYFTSWTKTFTDLFTIHTDQRVFDLFQIICSLIWVQHLQSIVKFLKFALFLFQKGTRNMKLMSSCLDAFYIFKQREIFHLTSVIFVCNCSCRSVKEHMESEANSTTHCTETHGNMSINICMSVLS